jgi:undecaprenyl-diphosphatase
VEAALGGAALIGAGALLLAVREHGHNLAIDQAPLALAREIHTPGLTAFMIGASRLVEPPVLWPVTLGAALLGVGRQRRGDFPWLAPVAVGGGVTLISVLKVMLGRARPAAFAHLAPARGYSLPSGHAFLAATLYGLLAHHGVRRLRARQPDDRRAAAALLAVSAAAILLVGISRVYLGVHYPTDVIAGYALALLWLLFLAAINDLARPPGRGPNRNARTPERLNA